MSKYQELCCGCAFDYDETFEMCYECECIQGTDNPSNYVETVITNKEPNEPADAIRSLAMTVLMALACPLLLPMAYIALEKDD